jgi:hypothetical protein
MHNASSSNEDRLEIKFPDDDAVLSLACSRVAVSLLKVALLRPVSIIPFRLFGLASKSKVDS